MKKNQKEMKMRRRILFALWILSLIGISTYGGAVSYGLFYAITLIPFISFAYLALVYCFFRVYQKVESRDMVCGQPTPYFFILQNDGYFPFAGVSVKMFSSFSGVEDVLDGTEYELLHGDKYIFKTKLTCKYRGEYEVGVKEVLVTDFLRLFRLRYRIPSTIRAIVRPKIVKVTSLKSLGEVLGFLQRENLQADTERDVIVRDYVEGDPVKMISWKMSAKEQKLKITNRIGEEKTGIYILGDTKRYSREIKEYLPLENKILEIMVALGIFLVEKNMTYVAYYGQSGIVSNRVDSVKEYTQYYDKLSRVICGEKEDFTHMLLSLTDHGSMWNAKVVFCVLHELNDVIMDITAKMAETGIIVILYVVTEVKYEDYVKQSNERRKIIIIPAEAELEGRL